jgi:hypothetical protein
VLKVVLVVAKQRVNATLCQNRLEGSIFFVTRAGKFVLEERAQAKPICDLEALAENQLVLALQSGPRPQLGLDRALDILLLLLENLDDLAARLVLNDVGLVRAAEKLDVVLVLDKGLEARLQYEVDGSVAQDLLQVALMLLGLLDGRRPGLSEAIGEEAGLIVGLVLELLAEEIGVCTARTSSTVNWRGGDSGDGLRGDDGALAWRRGHLCWTWRITWKEAMTYFQAGTSVSTFPVHGQPMKNYVWFLCLF